MTTTTVIFPENRGTLSKANLAFSDVGYQLCNGAPSDYASGGTIKSISLGDADVRKLAGKTSGQVAMSDLRGKSFTQRYQMTLRNVDGNWKTSTKGLTVDQRKHEFHWLDVSLSGIFTHSFYHDLVKCHLRIYNTSSTAVMRDDSGGTTLTVGYGTGCVQLDGIQVRGRDGAGGAAGKAGAAGGRGANFANSGFWVHGTGASLIAGGIGGGGGGYGAHDVSSFNMSGGNVDKNSPFKGTWAGGAGGAGGDAVAAKSTVTISGISLTPGSGGGGGGGGGGAYVDVPVFGGAIVLTGGGGGAGGNNPKNNNGNGGTVMQANIPGSHDIITQENKSGTKGTPPAPGNGGSVAYHNSLKINAGNGGARNSAGGAAYHSGGSQRSGWIFKYGAGGAPGASGVARRNT